MQGLWGRLSFETEEEDLGEAGRGLLKVEAGFDQSQPGSGKRLRRNIYAASTRQHRRRVSLGSVYLGMLGLTLEKQRRNG